MATQESLIKSTLTGDAPWAALVTGGTFDWDDLGNQGSTPENLEVLGAFNTAGALKVTCVVTFGADTPRSEIPSIAEQRFFTLWLYQEKGFAALRTAKKHAKRLLHDKSVGVSDDEAINTCHYDDAREFYAQELGSRPAIAIRFHIVYVRK